jgi:hypothetical protein
MLSRIRLGLRLGLIALLAVALAGVLNVGCSSSPVTSVKKWVGWDKGEEDEEALPPEAKEEVVMVDGKQYVRSKNPYWLTYPEQPEYLYVEKGKEFVGMQQHLINALAKAVGKEKAKAAGKGIPPDKLQELVRAEVDRILREQGLSGFVSRSPGERSAYSGRAVAVIPDLDTPSSYEGLNRTLAVALGDQMNRQKDLKVSSPEQVREALGKAGVTGKLSLSPNIQALGNYLGVQGIVLTGIVPPGAGSEGFLATEIYDTFLGAKSQAIVEPAVGGLKPETVNKFAQGNALRVAANLQNITWFGRVEFVKEGKTYLSLGQNAGLKVGDRLKVVTPGKEVVNPATHASLGFTADIPQGELKVTELLGDTGAVAQVVSGGPFKPNDRVKGVK